MVKVPVLCAALVLGGCATEPAGPPAAREGGSHACEIKPLTLSRTVRLPSGLELSEVSLPEIPFLPLLRFEAGAPGAPAGISWSPLDGAALAGPVEFCGYVNLARPRRGGLREGEIVTQTGIRGRRDVAFEPAALAFLAEAYGAGRFFELPEGRYVEVAAPPGRAVTVNDALAAASTRADIDLDRWTVTLSSERVYVPVLGGGPGETVPPPVRSAAAPAPVRVAEAPPAAAPVPEPVLPVLVAEGAAPPDADQPGLLPAEGGFAAATAREGDGFAGLPEVPPAASRPEPRRGGRR